MIEDFALYVDKVRIEGQGYEPIKKSLKILFPDAAYESAEAYVGQGYSMAAKERCELVSIRFQGGRIPSQEIIEHALNRVRLVIHYSSLYEAQTPFDSEKLRQSNS